MKTLSAVFATSERTERLQVAFDESTGLIQAVGALGVPEGKLDWNFPDECLGFAGMGDIHIHAREDVSGKHLYKEDFVTAGNAAINGGVTHVADMPNNPVPPIDDQSYRSKLALTEKSAISFLLYAGIGPHTRPLSKMVPYKAYMGPSIGELFFKDDQELDDVLVHYQGQHVSFHCEDPVEMHKHSGAHTHHERRPVECEVLATRTALRLIEKYKIHGKLCHYSAGEGLPLIREARKRGVEVLMEVTPQHLFYSQSKLKEKDRGLFQMNPPIREEADREAMLEAARSGEIDFLATDHAPHSAEEKLKGTSGLTGLDTFGSFVTWLIQDQNFSHAQIAKLCSENPGAFVNQFLPTLGSWHSPYQKLGLGFGFLKAGFVANFTILNLKRPLTMTKQLLKTKVGHSPFEGVTFPGQVEQVFIQGRTMK